MKACTNLVLLENDKLQRHQNFFVILG